MQINMDVTSQDLASLISVILLLIIRNSSINMTIQQFLREDTEEGAFNYVSFKVCRHFVYIYELVACSPAKKSVGISTTTELVVIQS